MLTAQNIGYIHPDKDLLFTGLYFNAAPGDKIALIGNNGTGKSTLLRILAGELPPSTGTVQFETKPYYVPQHFGQYDTLTIAAALGIDKKQKALAGILSGETSAENFSLLEDDWNIEERSREALQYWRLPEFDWNRRLGTLSGGQKTKVLLAGIGIHTPETVLLDEPSNHLDKAARDLLYNYISRTRNTVIVVSHDRTLLNLLDTTYELGPNGIKIYGGNYAFYNAQKAEAALAAERELNNKEKELRKAKDIQRKAMERQQKTDARGKKKQEKAGLPTISMNTLRNSAEKSTAKMKDVHAEKTDALTGELKQLRQGIGDTSKMRAAFEHSLLHTGKLLFRANAVTVGYTGKKVWPQPLSFEIVSGERIAITGRNGSGKTTLAKLLLGKTRATSGSMLIQTNNSVYIDQDYTIVDNELTVYDQAQRHNNTARTEDEVRIWLARFLFKPQLWDKLCATLSGGEKLRLALCCITLDTQAPDLIILDEPTNNLDIGNMEILTEALRAYKGTLIVISHDNYFLQSINITRTLDL